MSRLFLLICYSETEARYTYLNLNFYSFPAVMPAWEITTSVGTPAVTQHLGALTEREKTQDGGFVTFNTVSNSQV